MDQELKQLITERYELLSDDLKKALKSLSIEKITDEIVSQCWLRPDQAPNLHIEILLVILGIEKSSSFESNVKTNLTLTPDTAKNVANLAKQKVFNVISAPLNNIESLIDIVLKTNESGDVDDTSREKILSEIENPEPTLQSNLQPKPIATPISPLRTSTPPTNPNIFSAPKPSSPATPPIRPQSTPTPAPTSPNILNVTKTFPTPPRPPFQTPNNSNPAVQRPNMGPQTSENKPKGYPADPYREQSK